MDLDEAALAAGAGMGADRLRDLPQRHAGGAGQVLDDDGTHSALRTVGQGVRSRRTGCPPTQDRSPGPRSRRPAGCRSFHARTRTSMRSAVIEASHSRSAVPCAGGTGRPGRGNAPCRSRSSVGTPPLDGEQLAGSPAQATGCRGRGRWCREGRPSGRPCVEVDSLSGSSVACSETRNRFLRSSCHRLGGAPWVPFDGPVCRAPPSEGDHVAQPCRERARSATRAVERDWRIHSVADTRGRERQERRCSYGRWALTASDTDTTRRERARWTGTAAEDVTDSSRTWTRSSSATSLLLEEENPQFFDHRREWARTDWERDGFPRREWRDLLHECGAARTPRASSAIRCLPSPRR